ncbi:unnamed protein product [Macrosiphum euphorbiae]|uniref:Secreted protein n=1 Tax=Macrosiphum euphorbiae TaxID=13131 RepID=A0AAV0WLR5_9HEMI|nr:unnamed protein product [Macrosiphum euphorbiae]
MRSIRFCGVVRCYIIIAHCTLEAVIRLSALIIIKCNRLNSQSQLSKDVMIPRIFARFCGPFIVSMSLHGSCARIPPAIFAIAAIRIVRRRRIPAAADKRPLDPANHRSAGS